MALTDHTPREIMFALDTELWSHMGNDTIPVDRLAILAEVVAALVVEVEALRAAWVADIAHRGITWRESRYGEAYYRTALSYYNAAGPTSGFEKLLGEWTAIQPETLPSIFGGQPPARAAIMLRRLGLTSQELAEFLQEARDAATRT